MRLCAISRTYLRLLTTFDVVENYYIQRTSKSFVADLAALLFWKTMPLPSTMLNVRTFIPICAILLQRFCPLGPCLQNSLKPELNQIKSKPSHNTLYLHQSQTKNTTGNRVNSNTAVSEIVQDAEETLPCGSFSSVHGNYAKCLSDRAARVRKSLWLQVSSQFVAQATSKMLQ